MIKPHHQLRALLRTFGFDVVRYQPKLAGHEFLSAIESLIALRDLAVSGNDTEEVRFTEFCCKHWRKSRAQLFQDLFVQFELREKLGGYFVEFGAADGIHLSNTYSLEKQYLWKGILSEPARSWQAALRRNRDCHFEPRCVWDQSGLSVDFSEVVAAELSTVREFTGKRGELHAQTRRQAQVYKVSTISLNDMLHAFDAPAEIDYLSLDTEGSELKILSGFDFRRYIPQVITVEHNYLPDREKIHALLVQNGYRRKFELFSRWDDWYVLSDKTR